MNVPTKAIVIRALMAVVLLVAGAAPHACAHNKRLSNSYTYTIGDDLAVRMTGIFRIVAGLEASTLVYYDRKDHNIIADVVGSATDVEGAKRELEAFVGAVRQYVVTYAKRRHALDLTDMDVTLIYYNDGGEGTPFEVVRRVDGTYKVPPVPAAGSE